MEWPGLIPLAVALLPWVALFVGKNWIKAWIEKGVQHSFDEKIENLRSALRNQEERFKSDLRSKEDEITALRTGVLGGRAQRQALLDKRRIEAVERMWSAVIALTPYKMISSTMAVLKLDAVAKAAPREPKLRELFDLYAKQVPFPFDNPAKNEEPFAAPLAWAYFSAYLLIVFFDFALLNFLRLGIEEPEKLINRQGVKDALKTALPTFAEYIDKVGTYYYLLDPLQKLLLAELQKTLEGAELDEASVKRSTEIMKAVDKASIELEVAKMRAEKGAPEA